MTERSKVPGFVLGDDGLVHLVAELATLALLGVAGLALLGVGRLRRASLADNRALRRRRVR